MTRTDLIAAARAHHEAQAIIAAKTDNMVRSIRSFEVKSHDGRFDGQAREQARKIALRLKRQMGAPAANLVLAA